MKKYLLFDNDGVLVNTEQYYYEASKKILASRGCDLTKEMFIEVSLSRGVGVWEAFPGLFSEYAEGLMRKERNLLYREMLKNRDIFIEGVPAVLDQLSQQYKMAIVTSALRDDFLTIHSRTGYLKHFEFFLASGDYPQSKPSPSPYLTAMEKLNALPEECVIIEDTLRGAKAGVAAGITTIVIPNEMNREDDFSIAHYQLSSIKELPALLEEL